MVKIISFQVKQLMSIELKCFHSFFMT